jgi:hypothetical protein
VDAKLFFDTILPSEGLRCIAVPRPDKKFNHRFGPNNAWLAQASQHLDATGQIDVYFACASYLTPTRRKQSNVAWVRSFWADLDVGVSKPGKPAKYATQKEAAAAIIAFSDKLGFARPWLVDSGWGVHAYWPMDADMEPGVWKATAEALKRALAAEGVLADPSRTADHASVLRPPGTHNRKRAPKLVRLVSQGGVMVLQAFQKLLLAHMGGAAASFTTDPFAKLGPPPAGVAKGSSDLTAGVGFDPSSALMIADQCAIMGMMRDTRGNLDQPTWYGALGVLAETIEAPAIAHAWSKGHPTYSYAETEAKLAQAGQYPPTTCAKLGEQWADVCKACPHFGQIKSPIVLGRERAKPSTIETVEKTVAADGTIHETRGKLWMPNGYGEDVIDGRRVLTFTTVKRDKDGNVVERKVDPICNTFFWGVTRLWVDDVSQIEWQMETREGTREFRMDGSLIGKGGAEVLAALGSKEIIAKPGRERHVHSYMGNWMAHLTATTDQVMAYRSFGWAGDKFVLGDEVLNPNAPPHRAVLVGEAEKRAKFVTCKGDLQTWVSLVDRAYNAPGQEAFQFQLACAFAAPLLSLMDQVKGVTVYSFSEGSGVGKTTVQRVGLSAWGAWDDMMLAQGKTTNNALWGILGGYNSLPIVYDELTNAENSEVSELVFSVSSGRAKERMSASGETRTNNSNWSTILLASGNTLLSEKLSQHRGNAEAEISRLFEFDLQVDPHLSVVEANDLFPQFSQHYGHAGKKFAKYVTDHRLGVEAMLRKVQAAVVTDMQMEQVERHWSSLFAAVLVALIICRSEGLLAFDIASLKTWMRRQLRGNRDQKTAMVSTLEDQIGYMINELWDGVLVTTGAGDKRSGVFARVDKLPKSKLIGRAINPLTQNDPQQLYISRSAIRAWAAERGVSAGKMFETATKLGWCDPNSDYRFSLGKGTVEYPPTTSMVPCWRFYPAAMTVGATGQVVQQLTAIGGGKP